MGSGVLTGWIDRILARPIRHLFETPKRLLKDYVKDDMTVLDIGCGSGYYSLGMAELVGSKGRIISVDTQADAIVALRQKAERAGLSGRIETRVCSEKSLDISDMAGEADFAVAVYVVHHAADVAGLMSSVYEALKPGGKFLVIEPKHHASPTECEATEAVARGAGFAIAAYPHLKRNWAVVFLKS
jgi:ubiquinone/menaquinone biosynthesis C-methylase UbiE